jgi:ATP-dependent exoDNAse (exonuclease V) beta subunit
LLTSSANAADWTIALDVYEGTHAIPLMAIHKSKGLEYHSVIFVGLDDGAWWSFAGDQIEAIAGFFVAFTSKSPEDAPEMTRSISALIVVILIFR